MKYHLISLLSIICSITEESNAVKTVTMINPKQSNENGKTIRVDIKNNKHYTKEAILMMLQNADLTSIMSIKSILGTTRLFYDIDVEIAEYKNTIAVTLTVIEKPRIVRMTIHGNTLVSTETLCSAINLYIGAISYDPDDMKRVEETIAACYRKRHSFHGYNIKYVWRNLCKTADISFKHGITDRGVELDLYIHEHLDRKNAMKYAFYGLCCLYFYYTISYMTGRWKK